MSRQGFGGQALGILATIVLIAACGAGGGTERELPAGPTTTAPPSDNVLYVSYAQSNMVAAFRLGTDGFLPSTPFSTMTVEAPREMIMVNGILYIGSGDRVSSVQVQADGGLPEQPTAETGRVPDGDISDLVVVGDVLFATYLDAEVLLGFELDSLGHVPIGFTTTSRGSAISNYLSMAAWDGFIYAHAPSQGRIDTYRIRDDGLLDEIPEPQLPRVDLFGAEVMRIRDGVIYAAETPRERINTYLIDADGFPMGLKDGEEPISHTRAEERYVDFILEDNLLFAAAFNKGRLDVYEIDPSDGSLPENLPISTTEFDTGLFPTSLLLLDGLIYVTQSGRDRVDAFTVGSNGELGGFPATSTIPIEPGFPNAIVHAVFPP